MRAQIIYTVAVMMVAALAAPAAGQEFFPPAPPAPSSFDLFALQQARPRPQPRPGERAGQPRGPETTEAFSQTVRLGNGSLDVQNLAGTVTITGGGGNNATIQAVKRAFGRTDDERRRSLEQVQIEVREQGGRVDVRSRYPQNGRNINVIVDYTITVPQDAAVSVRTLSGDVRATNVRGELRLETASGSIDATGARRIAALKTLSGSVTLNDAQADGDISIATMSGTLVARNVRARSVDLSSISGDLQIADVESDRVTLKSMSGEVAYSGQLRSSGRYEMSTHSGDIRLQVATDGFELDASTLSGGIESNLPVTLTGGGRGRRGPGQAIRATFGNGGSALSLRTFSGDITINRR